MLPLPEVLRVARVLHRVWAERPQPDSIHAWNQFETLLAEVRHARNRVHLAARHQLHLTATRLRDEFGRRLEDVARQAELLRDEATQSACTVPERVEWVQDLRQLDAEFGALTVRWSDHVLRVVTEPITLEDVELGPFAIEFGWSSSRCFRGSKSFEVIALEPNPASGRDEVVHPHVEGRRLCPGDAAEPLRQAVDEGRLADAFLLVQSVLAAYNPGSPYVSLSEWDGFRCSNCGRRGSSHGRYSCEACDSDLCSECSDSCCRCSDTRCSDCLTACAVCDDRFCRGCLVLTPTERLICTDCREDCPACGARVAKDEIEDGRCAACAESAMDEEALDNPSEPELQPELLEATDG